jgi:hypothetical protein
MATTGGAVAFDGGSSRHDVLRCNVAGRFIMVVRPQNLIILKSDQYWTAIQASEDSCVRRHRSSQHIGDGKVSRSLLSEKGSIMPNTDISLDPSLTAVERPPCTKCDEQMTFSILISGPPGFDIRTFKCTACDHIEKVVVVRTNMMKWINSTGLRPPT